MEVCARFKVSVGVQVIGRWEKQNENERLVKIRLLEKRPAASSLTDFFILDRGFWRRSMVCTVCVWNVFLIHYYYYLTLLCLLSIRIRLLLCCCFAGSCLSADSILFSLIPAGFLLLLWCFWCSTLLLFNYFDLLVCLLLLLLFCSCVLTAVGFCLYIQVFNYYSGIFGSVDFLYY